MTEGRVDVLIGVDGSAEADAAAAAVVELFGSRLGRVTLAAVVPSRGREAESQAIANLRRVARHNELGDADLEILCGLPARELVRCADDGGFALVAVGERGAGHTTDLLGSTATHLARCSRLPVLMFGGQPRDLRSSACSTLSAVG